MRVPAKKAQTPAISTYKAPITPEDKILLEREICKHSFGQFFRRAWGIFEPADPLRDNWHIDIIADHLEALARSEITKLVINIPPGFCKSLECSVAWPAWIWTFRPEWRGLFGTYSQALTNRDSTRTRDIVESQWYQERFCKIDGWNIKPDQNRVDEFHNTLAGFRFATSRESKRGTGFRGNAVVADDPMSASEAMATGADKSAAIEKMVHWWDKVLVSRLNNQERDVRLVVMQRLATFDLAGHILASNYGYEHLCLPAEYDPKRSFITYTTDRKTGEKTKFREDPRKEPGELLFPAMYPKHVLDDLSKPLGRGGYEAQYNQNPASDDAAIFKYKWIRFWRRDSDRTEYPRPPGCIEGPARIFDPDMADDLVLSVDANFKDTKKGSRCAIHVWAALGPDRFLVDAAADRWGFVEACDQIRAMCHKWPTIGSKFVEDKANGPAIINLLSREIPGFIPLTPEGGKESRARACEYWFRGGNIYVLDGATWAEEVVTEWCTFPNSEADDHVDAATQALVEMSDDLDMAMGRSLAKR